MHWFLDPITKHYADFTGRATRKQYWMFILYYLIVFFGVALVLGSLQILSLPSKGGPLNEIVVPLLFGVVLLIMLIGLFIPMIALAVRRLHDTGRSGWWILLSLIPYIGGIILLVFYCLPSMPGRNKWGDNPYSVEVAPVMSMPAAAPADGNNQ